jgi:hypothetical protein
VGQHADRPRELATAPGVEPERGPRPTHIIVA